MDNVKFKYRSTTSDVPVDQDQSVPIDNGSILVEKVSDTKVSMYIDTGANGSEVSPNTRNQLFVSNEGYDIEIVDQLPNDASNHPTTLYCILEK